MPVVKDWEVAAVIQQVSDRTTEFNFGKRTEGTCRVNTSTTSTTRRDLVYRHHQLVEGLPEESWSTGLAPQRFGGYTASC